MLSATLHSGVRRVPLQEEDSSTGRMPGKVPKPVSEEILSLEPNLSLLLNLANYCLFHA